MTISSKLSDVGGLEFVVSEAADIDDVGGFSDAIQTVGAETAKFSGGSTMQANSGLKIGMSQLKINTAGATPGARTEVGADFVGWAVNGTLVDNNENTSEIASIGSPIAVIDYGSVAVRTPRLVGQLDGIGTEFGSTGVKTLQYEISDDNITYTDPVTTNKIWASLNVPAGGDMMGGIPHSSGKISFDDPNTQSFRFIKILGISTAAGGVSNTGTMFQVTEADVGVNQVTVRVRSSATLDTADGSVLISGQVMNELESLTFDTQLLLTGPSEFVTVEIVSLTSFDIPVTLSEITSVKEV